MLISSAMLVLIITGLAVSAKSAKKDWEAGVKMSAFGCVTGLLLQCAAGVLYVFNIFSSIISSFTK
ncbi:MAG: hypothetical protein J6Y81_07310 [Ruminococcus sp.]|nr:hypothetical protein [Ruminococcus sp.]